MILGGLGAAEQPSLLDSFLGVSPGYLKKKLEGIELLLWLSAAAGLAGVVVTAVKLRR